MTTNAIGRWNPAWGPEPVKQGIKARSTGHNGWYLIRCPRRDCRNHEGVLVYAPRARNGAESAEKYTCAICGCEMRQERIDARRA